MSRTVKQMVSSTSKRVRYVVVAVSMAGALFGVASCGQDSSSNSKNGEQRPEAKSDESQLEQRMDNILDMLQPDRLGISSDRDNAIASLNDSVQTDSQSTQSDGSPDGKELPLLSRLLSTDELARVNDVRFHGRDAEHIRNCRWYNNAAKFTTASASNDLDRIVDLFDYVVRNVDLIADESDAIPLEPFALFMLGRGTAEDRAWLFANLLRQLRFDAVILSPANTDKSDAKQSSHWLVGVLLEGKVYLFDPWLGLPIPIDSEAPQSALMRRPATLAEVLENDVLLSQLDLDSEHAYPLRSDDLKNPVVQMIGNTSFWSSKMRKVQTLLSGKRAFVVHDGLQDDGPSKGLFSRIVKAGAEHWNDKSIAVWSYPETRIEAYEQLNSAQQRRLSDQRFSFNAPVPIRAIDPNTLEIEYGQPQRRHLKTRTNQLIGDFSTAITSYLAIRLWERFPPAPKEILIPEQLLPQLAATIPPEVLRMHGTAAEEAFFWLGVC